MGHRAEASVFKNSIVYNPYEDACIFWGITQVLLIYLVLFTPKVSYMCHFHRYIVHSGTQSMEDRIIAQERDIYGELSQQEQQLRARRERFPQKDEEI